MRKQSYRSRSRFTFERKLFVAFLFFTLAPTLVLIGLLKDRIDRTIDLWQNPGVERAMEEALRLADDSERDSEEDREVSLRAVREGFHYYTQLRLYERYAKAKIAILTASILLAAAVSALFVGRWLARSLGRPVRSLVDGTRRVSEGELDVIVPRTTSDELGTLVDAFNQMTADLKTGRERLLRAERVATWAEAARRIAHEIKNALTPITLSLHRLERRAARMDGEERRVWEDCLRPILEEVENLKALAEEFSQFSRLPEPSMEPFDIYELLAAVAGLYTEGTGLDVRVRIDPGTPPALGDAELLRRVFSNLVKNAVEATGGKGTLLLDARAEGDRVAVRVADDGPGIPPDRLGRVFAPYFTTKREGTGLGLALVERIVLDHGGEIDVEPNRPRGTVFRILLPAAR
ncbi:MAG: HAMP domain-containing protein [Candidatus Eisenbacteria bacterium]|nr:HAMP domain-containing protein [Candidatus Eisenbacteria bacterium]